MFLSCIYCKCTYKKEPGLFKFDKYNASSELKTLTQTTKKVAIKQDDNEDDENDTTNYFFEEFEDIKKEIESLKIPEGGSKVSINTSGKNAIYANKKKQLEDEFNKMLLTPKTTHQVSKKDIEEAEARLLELQIHQNKIVNLFYELKQAEKVDICFMLDATGSMVSYIAEAKTVIHKIVDKLKNRFVDFALRVAFVGYRDHSEGSKRITVLDFSEDKETFKTFVSSVEAIGGGDECEDVFGGLQVVILLCSISIKHFPLIWRFQQNKNTFQHFLTFKIELKLFFP